jgi:hypothetical protein
MWRKEGGFAQSPVLIGNKDILAPYVGVHVPCGVSSVCQVAYFRERGIGELPRTHQPVEKHPLCLLSL